MAISIKRPKDKMIDVLLLCQNDWANTGWRFTKCLQMLGLNAVMFKGQPHPFGYPVEAPIHPSLTMMPIDIYPVTLMTPGIEGLLKSAHVVHLLGSTCIRALVDWERTNVVVQHGGSTYRIGHKRANHVFNEIADATIIQCPDLLGLGAKNEHLIYYPVDTVELQPFYDRLNPEKVIIGHFPSTPTVKGTPTIIGAIQNLMMDKNISERFEYVGVTNLSGSDHRVSWSDNLIRMKSCDIIIETCNKEIAGQKFGEWGNTALEAAALGCVVVTNSLTQDLYKKEYGDCALHIANDQEALEKTLKELICLTDNQFLEEKKKARKWAEEKHSMMATAKRLWDKVYYQFFS